MLRAEQPHTRGGEKIWVLEVRGDAGWCQRRQDRRRSVVGGGEGGGRRDDSMHIGERGGNKDG